MQRNILFSAGAIAAMMLGSTLAVSAQVAVYNNIVNFTGQSVTNGVPLPQKRTRFFSPTTSTPLQASAG